MGKGILLGFALMIGFIVSNAQQQETKTNGNPLLKASSTAEKPSPTTHVAGDPRLTKMSTTTNDTVNTVNTKITKTETKVTKAVIDK